MLQDIIPNSKLNFKSIGLNNFNYKMLMSETNIDIATSEAIEIIELYNKLDLKKYFIINKKEDEKDSIKNIYYLYQKIREDILTINSDEKYVVDVLVEYLYKNKKSNYKTTLWSSFGDVIVDNINKNINTKLEQGYIQCAECKRLVKPKNNKTKYCKICAKEIQFNQKKHWDRTKRKQKSEK